jgi:hypothetical protein
MHTETRMKQTLRIALALTVAAGLHALPADAQAKKNNGNKAKDRVEQRDRRPELQRRDDVRWEDVFRDRRYEAQRAGNGAGKVPPGWCQGRGNPHNTPENCGYARDRRYDSRTGDRRGGGGGYANFEEAHRRFHLDHDRRCRERAAQRPLDVQWQVRVRSECRAEHVRWHERNDPTGRVSH